VIISPYLLNVGGSTYDMRKVAMYTDDLDAPGYVQARFINVNETTVRLNKVDFEAAYQAAMTASVNAANVVVASTGWTYYGDPVVIGTWRQGRLGNDLVAQRNDAGTFITKNTIVG